MTDLQMSLLAAGRERMPLVIWEHVFVEKQLHAWDDGVVTS